MKRKKFAIEDLPHQSIAEDSNQKFGLPDISIPAEVLFNPNLNPTQKILFGFIRNLAKSEKGCWASNHYLARCLDVEKQTITNGITRLKEYLYITVEFKKMANGHQGRVIFVDNRFPQAYEQYTQQVFKNITSPLLKKLYPPIKEIIPPYKNINGNIYNKINSKSTSSEEEDLKKAVNGYITVSDFQKFCKIYPSSRIGSKGAALSKWETLCNNKIHRPTWNRIERAIKKQKGTPRWQDPQFIPLASTWINQKRWLDDPALMVSFDTGVVSEEQQKKNQASEEAEWRRQMGYDKDDN